MLVVASAAAVINAITTVIARFAVASVGAATTTAAAFVAVDVGTFLLLLWLKLWL